MIVMISQISLDILRSCEIQNQVGSRLDTPTIGSQICPWALNYIYIYIISPIPQKILGVINLNQSHITLVTLHLKSPWHPKRSQSNPSKSPFFIQPSPQIPVPHAPPEAAAELCAIWSLPPWLRRRSRCWPGNMGRYTQQYGGVPYGWIMYSINRGFLM